MKPKWLKYMWNPAFFLKFVTKFTLDKNSLVLYAVEVNIKYQESIILKYQHFITIEITDRKYEKSLQCSNHISKLEALYCRHPIWICANLKPGTQESILFSVFLQKISTTYQNCCRITKFKTSKENWVNFKKWEKIIFKYMCIISYITLVFNLAIVGILSTELMPLPTAKWQTAWQMGKPSLKQPVQSNGGWATSLILYNR